jgi:hypothetical protein
MPDRHSNYDRLVPGLALALLGAMSAMACGGTASSDLGDGGAQQGDAAVEAASGRAGGQWIWQSAAGVSTSLTAVWAASSTDVWAVGGGIVHWDGMTWKAFPSGTMENLYGIWGSSSDDAWAVGGGYGGPDAYTLVHWDGKSWSNQDPGTPDNLYGVWGAAPNDVWAVGASGVEGTITHFDGTRWTVSQSGLSNDLRAVFGTAANDVWAVGGAIYPSFSDQTTMHYTGTWTPVSSHDSTKELDSIWASGPDDAWAVGFDTKMLHWDGTSWSTTSDETLLGLWGVWGSTKADVWAVGVGKIVHNDGSAWASYASGGANLSGVGGADADHVWAVGANGTIMTFDPTATRPVTCEQIDGTCGAASACAVGHGHFTNYACSSGGNSCCVSQTACGPVEPACCDSSGARAGRAECQTGVFVCVGSMPCPMPPG